MGKADRVPQTYGLLMSDEQAAHALDLSITSFRKLVDRGVIPKGKTVLGCPGTVRWHQSVIFALSYHLIGMAPPAGGVDSAGRMGAALSPQTLDDEFE